MRSFFSAILLISIFAFAFSAPPQLGGGYVGSDQQAEPIGQRRQGEIGGGNNDQQLMKETAVGEIGEKMRQHELERMKRETVGQKVDEGIEKVNETGQGIREKVEKAGETIGQKVNEGIGKANQTGREIKESVGEKMEKTGENIREARDTIGQNIDEGIEKTKETGEGIKESAGKKVEEAGENIRNRRTIGQNIDEGIEKAKETGQGIKESAGEKVEQAGESVRQARETIGQKVDEGLLEARKKGTELKENAGIRDRRETVGQNIDEGVEKAKQKGEEIKESAGKKVEEVGENIRNKRDQNEEPRNEDALVQMAKNQKGLGELEREKRETVGQKVDEGILEARKKGTELKENVGEKMDQVGEKMRERRNANGALGMGEGRGHSMGGQPVHQKGGQEGGGN